jgi:hypothetical protein
LYIGGTAVIVVELVVELSGWLCIVVLVAFMILAAVVVDCGGVLMVVFPFP